MSIRHRSLTLALIASSMIVVLTTPVYASPSLVALWHMDETSGTTAFDSSGNENNGVDSNITFVAPGFDGTGGAYSFNGTSQVVTPNSPSLNPGTADITLAAHVNTSVLPGAVGDYDIIRKKKSAQIYKMEIIKTGQGYCQFKGTVANGVVKGGPNVVDGRWHAIVCAKTATQISLTVDGVTVAKKVVTVGSISNTIGVYLGRKPDGTDAYTGLMDEVSITIG
jgi:hypothetical protein